MNKMNNETRNIHTALSAYHICSSKQRGCLKQDIRPKVFSYMSGIITSLKHKSIIVNGMSDHVHILLGLHPNISISNTVHDIKRSTSLFINKEKFCQGKFNWQEGYASFTYSRSQIDRIYNYIKNQEMHHAKSNFETEYSVPQEIRSFV